MQIKALSSLERLAYWEQYQKRAVLHCRSVKAPTACKARAKADSSSLRSEARNSLQAA